MSLSQGTDPQIWDAGTGLSMISLLGERTVPYERCQWVVKLG
jgi:hypothetical protein